MKEKNDKALVRKEGLSTHICLMRLKYLKHVLQYLFFLACMESRRGLVLKCFVEDSARVAALLNHTNLLVVPAAANRNRTLTLDFVMLSHALVV